MKQLMFAVVIALLFAAEGAFAACSPPGASQVTNAGPNTNLTDLLSGNTVCVPNPDPETPPKDPPRDSWKWQEEHHQNGELWDYKLGANNPVDPRKLLGTWAVSGNGANTVVTYTYTTWIPNDVRTIKVWNNGDGTYSFCDQGSPPPEPDVLHPEIVATIRSGIGSCP